MARKCTRALRTGRPCSQWQKRSENCRPITGGECGHRGRVGSGSQSQKRSENCRPITGGEWELSANHRRGVRSQGGSRKWQPITEEAWELSANHRRGVRSQGESRKWQPIGRLHLWIYLPTPSFGRIRSTSCSRSSTCMYVSLLCGLGRIPSSLHRLGDQPRVRPGVPACTCHYCVG
jgi:hypothetical protein